jgi:predicted MFS family arabinose efflux permease
MATVNAVGVVVLQPVLYGPLSRLPRLRVLAASWLLVACGVASTGLAHSVWQFVLTTLVWTVGEVGNGVVAGGIVADLAPDHARGRYQGAISWAWAVARLVSPALVTGLIAVGGRGALWWTILAIGLLSASLVWRLGPAIAFRTNRR